MNNPNETEEQAQALRRRIKQAQAYYFHCMDLRLWDTAETVRLQLAADVAALNALTA